MYFNYIFVKFLKRFFIVWFSLGGVFVIFNFLFTYSKLPKAVNKEILYVFYTYLYSLDTLFSISLIFAFLLTLNHMIKFNELVSFYSLGFSKNKIFKVFLIAISILSFGILALNFTKFAYSNLYAQKIIDKRLLSTEDLFLKYDDKIIYIEKLDTFRKIAFNVTVFYVNKNRIYKIIKAKKLIFSKNSWYSDNAEVIFITANNIQKTNSKIDILKNFKPRVLSTLKKLKAISFYDAYLAIKYFKDIDKNEILALVFFKIFSIISMGLLIYIVFQFSPIHIRISNIYLFMLKSIFASLFIWGVMLLSYKFAKQGILPYWSLSLPGLILFVFILIFKRRFNEL